MSLACHAAADAADNGSTSSPFTGCRLEAERLMHHIQALLDEDVVAYREVLAALRLPQSTDESRAARRTALDKALEQATRVPLDIAQAGLEVLSVGISIAPLITVPIAGDLAAAVHLSEAAVKGSLRNARMNLATIQESSHAQELAERLQEMTTRLQQDCLRAEEALRVACAD